MAYCVLLKKCERLSVCVSSCQKFKMITDSPLLSLLGIPVRPEFGSLLSGPGAGEVTLLIKTEYSGVDRATQQFRFVITPFLDGEELDYSVSFARPNYVSEAFESLTVSGLMPGQSYTFRATAMNIYGTSESTNSSLVIAGIGRSNCMILISKSLLSSTFTVVTKNNAGIIGGAVGGVMAVIIAIVGILIVLLVLLHLNRGS